MLLGDRLKPNTVERLAYRHQRRVARAQSNGANIVSFNLDAFRLFQ